MPTINSVALPKVTLSNPPIPCPTFLLNSSVAKLSSEAKGMRAKKFVVNTIVGDHSKAPEINAKGRKINRMLMYALKRMVRMSLRGLEETSSCESEGLPSRGLRMDGVLSLSISPPFWVLDITQDGRQFDETCVAAVVAVVVGERNKGRRWQ